MAVAVVVHWLVVELGFDIFVDNSKLREMR